MWKYGESVFFLEIWKKGHLSDYSLEALNYIKDLKSPLFAYIINNSLNSICLRFFSNYSRFREVRPFCSVLTKQAVSQWSFLHGISNRKFAYPIETCLLSMFHSFNFCLWAPCFWVKGLWSLEFFITRQSFYAESTVYQLTQTFKQDKSTTRREILHYY